VFKLVGHVGPHRFTALLDSGASGPGFISPAFAKQCGLTLAPSANTVQLADGTIVSAAGQVTIDYTLSPTKGAAIPFTSQFTATPLESYDIILGVGWLEQHDVQVGWRQRALEVRTPGRASRHIRPIEVIDGPAPAASLATISYKSLRKELKRGRILEAYAVIVRPDPLTQAAPAAAAAHSDPAVAALLAEFADVMPDKLPAELPPFRGVEHGIQLKPGSQPPAARGLRNVSAKDAAVINEFLQKGLAAGQLRVSHSPYGSMLVIAKKKDGSPRVCVDYRALNEITVKNKYPLPLMDELFDRVQGAQFFSTIDLRDGFYQIRLAEGDSEKTAFRTAFGSFEYLVLPMGLCNAPATFMELMNQTFFDLLNKSVLCFLDDILIFSKTREEHLAHIREVLERLRKNKLYGKLSKCDFMQKEVSFLGHRLGANGLAVSPDKISAVRDWPAPRNAHDVRSFLGLAGFYRKFVQNFSKIALPLTELTHDKAPWEWGADQRGAFDALKAALCSAPVLLLPDPSLPYTLNCDACNYAIGATLQQDQGNGLQPVAYRSKKLSPAERNYDTREKEFMSLVDACSHWRHYLHSEHKIKLMTDHHSLTHFRTMPHLTGRLARWVEKMADYDFDLEHIAGAKNVVADALSRRHDLEQADAPAPAVLAAAVASPARSILKRRVSFDSPNPFSVLMFDPEAAPAQLNAAAARLPAAPDTPAQAALRQQHRDSAEKMLPADTTLPRPQKNGTIATPSQQCTAETKAGAHCKQRTAIGQYCWSHLKSIEGLRVKKSTVPSGGRGLFAARALPAGTNIPYTGDEIILRSDENGGPYVLELRRDAAGNSMGVDAARRNSGYARWVNDPKGTASQANSKFVLFTPPRGRQRIASVRTTKALAEGEEILVSYGNTYWRYHQAASQRAAPQRKRAAAPRKRSPAPAAPIAPIAPVAPASPARVVIELDALQEARPSHDLTRRISFAGSQDKTYSALVASPPAGHEVMGDLLFVDKTRLVVPNVAALRTEILAQCHDALTGGHFGRDKTLEAVKRRFHWDGLAADVASYVASCDACQRNKPSQQLTPGPLMPLPIPERVCSEWTTDAVTGLPKTRRGHDAIQVYVDRLSKLKYFAPSHSTAGAVELAQLFQDTVISRHGVPEVVVSDRDPRFTAHYYAALSKLLGIDLNMSTARHPQTDGQSENSIKSLIIALRAFCNDNQDDWDDQLSMLQLGFNSAVQASTQRSPNSLVYGFEPRLPIDVALDTLTPSVPAAVDRAARIQQAVQSARGQLGIAQERQSRNADRRRRALKLAVGDQVLLTTEGLQLRNFTNKLCSRFIGPFAITKMINANAFELALPPQLQALHPVFNISRLKQYVANNSKFAARPVRFDRPPPEAEADTNGDTVFEVERIVAARGSGRGLRYLVAWKGYPPEENTWEPRATLACGAREALDEFEATHGRAAAAA